MTETDPHGDQWVARLRAEHEAPGHVCPNVGRDTPDQERHHFESWGADCRDGNCPECERLNCHHTSEPTDSPVGSVPLTPAQADAFREYVHQKDEWTATVALDGPGLDDDAAAVAKAETVEALEYYAEDLEYRLGNRVDYDEEDKPHIVAKVERLRALVAALNRPVPPAGYTEAGEAIPGAPEARLEAIRSVIGTMDGDSHDHYEAALNQIADIANPPYEDYLGALESNVFEHQYEVVKAKYGDEAAGNTNYGWGVNVYEGTVGASSKVYGHGILTTIASKIGEYADEWSSL